MRELDTLLKQAVKLFPDKEKQLATYNFTLGRFPGHWRFSVVNSWHKWSQNKLETQFSAYSPEEAVSAFLTYVRENKINVKKLAD